MNIDEVLKHSAECIKWPPHSKETKALFTRMREVIIHLRAKLVKAETKLRKKK